MVSPAAASEIRDAAESWKQHTRSTIRLKARDFADEEKAPTQSIEEFIKAQAPIPQILRNFPDVTEDGVLEMAQMMGVKLSQRSIVPANPIVAAREHADMTEAKLAELEAELSS